MKSTRKFQSKFLKKEILNIFLTVCVNKELSPKKFQCFEFFDTLAHFDFCLRQIVISARTKILPAKTWKISREFCFQFS